MLLRSGSCSKLPPCLGVTASNYTSMSSCGRGFKEAMPTHYLHVRPCVIVGCSGLLGLCFFDMPTLHFSLISLIDRAFVSHFLMRGIFLVMVVVGVSLWCVVRSIVATGLGMVMRWVDVKAIDKVMVVRARWINIGLLLVVRVH